MKITYSDDGKCRTHLEFLQSEFEKHLSGDLSPRTVRKQSAIIGLFIDFICFDCALKDIDEITIGMANSYFWRWHLSKIGDATKSELKTAVKKFFIFLNKEHGIRNEKILNSFKRK